jgi:hypothetical protein
VIGLPNSASRLGARWAYKAIAWQLPKMVMKRHRAIPACRQHPSLALMVCVRSSIFNGPAARGASSNTPISCRSVARRHSRLFRSSSTIADARQYPKRLAARSSPFAMADAARSIAGRSSRIVQLFGRRQSHRFAAIEVEHPAESLLPADHPNFL